MSDVSGPGEVTCDIGQSILKAEPFSGVVISDGQYWCRIKPRDRPVDCVSLGDAFGYVILCNVERCMNTGQVRFLPVKISDLPEATLG